jgi:dienelactone hydrolase
MPDALSDFTRRSITLDGGTRDVFVIGTGPAVIVMAEVPGITPKVADFARTVAAIGCSAWVPDLFGTPGADPTPVSALGVIARACISREFTTWACGEASAITVWLRALAKQAHEECGGPGVGAVGMCLTGNFALAMMVDPWVVAPVLSQPSLPFAVTKKQKADVAISSADLATVKERVADGVCLLGLRFTGDPMAPAARFDTLARELGDGFIRVDIDSSKGNPAGNPRAAHSVLTEHLVDEPGHPTREALDRVLELFRTRLLV